MNYNLNELLMIIGELTLTNRRLVTEIEQLRKEIETLKESNTNK